LFRHWEQATPDERGYAALPESGATIQRTGLRALGRSMGILATCVREAPEFGSRRRRRQLASAGDRPASSPK
jgi:hypothetical protein